MSSGYDEPAVDDWGDDEPEDAERRGFYRGFTAAGGSVCTCEPEHQPGCASLRRAWWRRLLGGDSR